MLDKILTDRQEALLSAEREALRDLQTALVRFDAEREDLTTLEDSIGQLDELFLLVVVGEFNAGKSTFINALLGHSVLPEGVTPTTTRIHLLEYGETRESRTDPGEIEVISFPADLLRQVHIVDTPGTNALERRHEAITRDFVPRSDLVLFVTSADRPFTESERAFMERIREWGKKLVLVVNKIDFLRLDSDVEQVVGFIIENSRRLLGFEPEVFPVSSQQALAAKLEGGDSPTLPEESRFASLERYLADTLDEEERVRLKLLNPLGVGRRLEERYRRAAAGRLDLLREDIRTLEDLERQLGLYREDLTREFRFRLTDVDNLLHELEKRGTDFFDQTFRLPRAIDLLNKARVKADFERQVIAGTPRRIEQKVDEIIDWMVGAELRHWQAVGEHLADRKTRHADRLVGKIGSFDYDRGQLLETVGRAAQRTIEGYDREREANRMAESVQTAVAGTALIEVGAIGLGAVVTMMATTQLADFTGLLAAGTLAVLGLFILPARRRRAKKELSAKILDLRQRLMAALTEQFEQEVERSIHRLREAVAPYTRFVRAERQRLEEMRGALEAAGERLRDLERRIEEL